MDLCHLKNSELEPRHQKYRGRVVLRGDIVKDDSGSYAAFTEKGSSASQMTAAKVMDVAARLPGCAGQSSRRSISIRSSKNERRSKIAEKYQNQNVQTFWIRLPRHKRPTSWSSIEDLVVARERNLYHPLACFLCERHFEMVLLGRGWAKGSNCECPFVHRTQGFFLSVYVDDIKMAGKKRGGRSVREGYMHLFVAILI